MNVFTPKQWNLLLKRVHDDMLDNIINKRSRHIIRWLDMYFDSDYRNIETLIKTIFRSQVKHATDCFGNRLKKIEFVGIGTYFIKQGRLDIEHFLRERGYISQWDCPFDVKLKAVNWAKAKKYNRRCFGIRTTRSYNIPQRYDETAPLYHHKSMKFFTCKYLFMDENAVYNIAKIVWEADKGFVEMESLIEVPHWEDIDEWQQQKVCADVSYLLEYANAPESALHELWLDGMKDRGWSYGAVVDKDNKLHPHMTEYNELPIEEKIRYNLLWTIVRKFEHYKRKYDKVSKDKPNEDIIKEVVNNNTNNDTNGKNDQKDNYR